MTWKEALYWGVVVGLLIATGLLLYDFYDCSSGVESHPGQYQAPSSGNNEKIDFEPLASPAGARKEWATKGITGRGIYFP